MMSPNKTKKGAVAISDSSPEPVPSCSKRSRSKMSSDDEDDVVPKKAPSKSGSKSKRSPSFSAHNKPAELFRKDLISAMKLADSEPLQDGSYYLISDPWRQEWEKGVQVPVNMTEIMQADVREIHEKNKNGLFRMPHKFLHERLDSSYKKGVHELTGMQQLSEQLVRYDLDDLDVSWLEEVNFSRREMGLTQINEWDMERVMEALENQCHEQMTAVMKTEEGMGIEYDEDIVCDVCCSPESEDTNEMVFCDGCNVCIHQACYGIQSIPEGSWLCRTCALGIKPKCILCPKVGGAMKSTRSGTKWAHVSCALWIPEVSIGIPEKMEPITKISNIPPSRWALVCCLCKEREGACIQCSVKTCKTAFHVTCGFSHGLELEMKTVIDDTEEHDGIKLKAYCPKHTKKRERGHSESDTDSPRKDGPPTPKKEMTQQERDNLRAEKLKSLEEDFHSQVDVEEVCTTLDLEKEIVSLVFCFWKLKRKCNWNKPLLTPKTEEADILEKQQEDSLVARMKMFVHLRQDLERVRNLCYMIGKREKTKRQFFRSKEYVFTSMVRVLLDKSVPLSKAEVDDILHNYHFDSVYDDYGLSVQNLPPELSQEEDQPVDAEEKEEGTDLAESQQDVESAVEEVVEETVPEEPTAEEEEEEDPSHTLSPGERWSGKFVRSGFFKRRRHKMWIKGPVPGKAKKKKMPSVVDYPQLQLPTLPIKKDKVLVDDDNVFNTSADETDEDKEKLAAVVKAFTEMDDDKSDEGMDAVPSSIPSLALPVHRPKKRQRGRKPWHMKEPYHYDLDSNLDFNTDDNEDMKVTPVTNRVTREVQQDTSEQGVLDVEGCDKKNTSEEHLLVDIEGQNNPIAELLSDEQSPSVYGSTKNSDIVVNKWDKVKLKPDQFRQREEDKSGRTKLYKSKSKDRTKHDSSRKRYEKRKVRGRDRTFKSDDRNSSSLGKCEISIKSDKSNFENIFNDSDSIGGKFHSTEMKFINKDTVSENVDDKTEDREGRRKHRSSGRSSRRASRKSGHSEVWDSSQTDPAQKEKKDYLQIHTENTESGMETVSQSWPSGITDCIKTESKKEKDTHDTVKPKTEQNTQATHRNRLSMTRQKSNSSGHSSERSNIFESLERHCREGSLDLGLGEGGSNSNEPTKGDQSVSWHGKVHDMSSFNKPFQLTESTDHWLFGGSLKSGPDSAAVETSNSAEFKNASDQLETDTEMNKDTSEPTEMVSRDHSADGQLSKDTTNAETTDKGVELSSTELQSVINPADETHMNSDKMRENHTDSERATEPPPHNLFQVMAQIGASKAGDSSLSKKHKLSEKNSTADSVTLKDKTAKSDSISPKKRRLSKKKSTTGSVSHKDKASKHDSSPLKKSTLSEKDSITDSIVHDDKAMKNDDVDLIISADPAESNRNVGQVDAPHHNSSAPTVKDSEGLSSRLSSLRRTRHRAEEGDDETVHTHNADRPRRKTTAHFEEMGHVIEPPDETVDSHNAERPRRKTTAPVGERGHIIELPDETVDSHDAERPRKKPTAPVEEMGQIIEPPDETIHTHNAERPRRKTTAHVEEMGQIIEPPDETDESLNVERPCRKPTAPVEVGKIIEPSNETSYEGRPRRKSSAPVEEVQQIVESPNEAVNTQSLERPRRKSSVHVAEVQPVMEPVTREKPVRKNGHHAEGEHTAPLAVEARIRQRRKSSHEARLKLNKVLTAPDTSSDDDFEPVQPKIASFPRRPRHARLSKKSTLKQRKNDLTSNDETSEEEEHYDADANDDETPKRRGSLHSKTRDPPHRRESVDKSSRTGPGDLRPDLAMLFKPSDLIVKATLVKRVQDSVLRLYKYRDYHPHVNGGDQLWKTDTVLGKNIMGSITTNKDSCRKESFAGDSDVTSEKTVCKARVLNEITSERSSNYQKNIFGAHYSPRGSLSGYKIPKKSSIQPTTPAVSSNSLQTSPPLSGPFGGRKDFTSFRSLATAGGPGLYHRTEGSVDEKLQKKCDTPGIFEAMSSLGSEQSDSNHLSLDNCCGYRSHSPVSEASVVMARHSDSRESTPRRVTRSQLVDEPVENSPSPHGRNRIQLRDGVLKASHFAS